jgi:hypothetical protein
VIVTHLKKTPIVMDVSKGKTMNKKEQKILQSILNESDYDAGLLNSYGGGDVIWWFDYIRAEVNRCNEYWRSIVESHVEE